MEMRSQLFSLYFHFSYIFILHEAMEFLGWVVDG
jgi:hypothetical protein